MVGSSLAFLAGFLQDRDRETACWSPHSWSIAARALDFVERTLLGLVSSAVTLGMA